MILFFASSSVFGQANEVIANEGPAPNSAEDLEGPISIAFSDDEKSSEGLWGGATDWLKNKPLFWSDMTLEGNFRTYYFLRDNGTTSSVEENEAWAAGGTINVESGKLWDTISIGAEYFLSAPVAASDNTPGSGLLKPVQNTISVLGQGYIRGTFNKQVVTLGRQRINKPYINGNDSRMQPNTFEAITVDGRWKQGRFFVGYIDKIKVRNSDRFVSVGERAGVQGSDNGMMQLGTRYEWGDGNFIGIISNAIPDILATTYSELDMRWGAGDWGFRAGAQLTDQRSIGDDLLTGVKYDTQSFGARFSASINNFIFTGVVSANGDGADIRAPFGGDPSFTTLMLSNFNLANQKTYRLGVSYTGAAYGYPGVSGYVNYARSRDAQVALTGAQLPRDEELDITIDFRPGSGVFGGAWLRTRYGVINYGTDRKRYNVRVTLNWPFKLL